MLICAHVSVYVCLIFAMWEELRWSSRSCEMDLQCITDKTTIYKEIKQKEKKNN